MKFFTFVGLTRSVQSDQGSNFMLRSFQQVIMNLALNSTSHPLIILKVRLPKNDFIKFLKNMIRSYCFDTEKDWGESK